MLDPPWKAIEGAFTGNTALFNEGLMGIDEQRRWLLSPRDEIVGAIGTTLAKAVVNPETLVGPTGLVDPFNYFAMREEGRAAQGQRGLL